MFSMLKSGVEHGTTEEDIMGCLYFHVKDQLVMFCERLRRFRMSIWMYDEDAVKLSNRCQPPCVSNIMDTNYVGIPKVLETWGPLLNRRYKDSVLIGSFINWAPETPGAIASHSPPVATRCMNVMRRRLPNWQEKGGDSNIMTMISSLDLFNENSGLFKAYFRRNGADVAARKAGLRMREKNEIVPHRIATSVNSDWSTLPAITTDEDWYNLVCLSGLNHCERFVEWTVL
ncbi:hypothetical protein CPB85DRAFT_1553245 [Mucidula mucida]|nr:hypothetical protein CPB85DRAFT_1553245 [Mucidula mucida]